MKYSLIIEYSKSFIKHCYIFASTVFFQNEQTDGIICFQRKLSFFPDIFALKCLGYLPLYKKIFKIFIKALGYLMRSSLQCMAQDLVCMGKNEMCANAAFCFKIELYNISYVLLRA